MSARGLNLLSVLGLSVGMHLAPQCHALEGRVIDGVTGKPLAGVYVIGAWVVSSGFGVISKTGCEKLEVTRSDDQGRFSLSNWSGSVLAHFVGTEMLNDYYYMRGYRWEKGSPVLGETVVLVPDMRPPLQRLEYLNGLAGNADCGSFNERKVKSLTMYQEMYEEARPIAVSYDERQALSGLLFMVEWLELGGEQAQKNSLIRLNRGYQ